MKVGVNFATELKEESIRRGANFSDLLMEYMEEDILDRVYTGKYGEKLWLIIGASGDRKCEGRVEFYFDCKREPISEKIMEEILADLSKSQEISWMYNIRQEKDGYTAEVFGEYREMQVPLVISVYNISDEGIKPRQMEWQRILKPGKTIKYWAFSPESRMGECLFEIMNKLELINDMEAYYMVNEILKKHSVSGRQIVEEITGYSADNQKILKEKRVDQIKSYREYGYMRKRWSQYCRRNKLQEENWEEVIDRIISFTEPVWKALCNNEVFFDDWMPELGRFLG